MPRQRDEVESTAGGRRANAATARSVLGADHRVELVDRRRAAAASPASSLDADERSSVRSRARRRGDAGARGRSASPRWLAERRLVGVDGWARYHSVAAAALDELADGGRLARAGRPDDHRQRHLPGAVEQAVHPVSGDRPHRGRLEPGPRKADGLP